MARRLWTKKNLKKSIAGSDGVYAGVGEEDSSRGQFMALNSTSRSPRTM